MFAGFGFREQLFNYGSFKKTLSCYPVSFMEGKDRPDVEDGGKIILPPSALDELTRRNIQYPMLFKLTNTLDGRSTHCGVLEFVADEGKAYLPYWMMRNLLVQEGSQITVENVSLATATYVKIQPQSTDFLDISNPKAVLEKALRFFACLTVGDIIAINYNEKRYELSVLELKPAQAVSIIECDMNVEFAAPVGYKEPEPQFTKPATEEEDDAIDYAAIRSAAQNKFKAFSTEGVRLDGKKHNSNSLSEDPSDSHYQRGVPNYDYKKGKITFIRNARPKTAESDEAKPFSAFQGEGQNLSRKKR